MRRLGSRLAMALVGGAILVAYLGAAALVAGFLVALWRSLADPLVTLAAGVATALTLGYLNYRSGTAGLLAGLDAVALRRERTPGVYARLDRLCRTFDIEPPDLVLVRTGTPNALALGDARRGVVAVDPALLRLLSGEEFEAVLAHELAHLEGNHGLRQALATGLLQAVVGVSLVVAVPAVVIVAGVARTAAWFGGRPHRVGPFGRAHVLLGRLAAFALVTLTLLARARSRRSEFRADDRAAAVTGNPLALARALRKMERAATPGWGLFLPPYAREEREKREDPVARALATHPSTDERVERLLARSAEDEPRRWRHVRIE